MSDLLLSVFFPVLLTAAAQAQAVSKVQATAAPPEIPELLAETKDCEDCPSMVRIPSLLGHSDALYAARHELTWKEYVAAVKQASCPLPQPPYNVVYSTNAVEKYADDYPVNYLAPDNFQCYLNWISKKTGHRYRLPSAAEWDHLARAGSKTRYPWGNDLGQGNAAINFHYEHQKLQQHSRFDLRFRSGQNIGLVPVESFQPNAWGLYDVVGNVAEYVNETKPAPETCAAKFGTDRCQLIAVRGGGIGSIGYRITGDQPARIVGEGEDFVTSVRWTYARLGEAVAQPHGYRLVRN